MTYLCKEIERIAEAVLGEDEMFKLSGLLKKGKFVEAKELVLEGVDGCFEDWFISFSEAAEFYNLLDLPPARMRQFPQIRCRRGPSW